MLISEEIQNRWQLKNCREIKPNVYEAESEAFGPVIVKLGKQTAREYRALCRMGGCRVFAFDEDRNALLEERILPGISLREESSAAKRMEALHQVLSAIHTPETEGETYLDWLDHVCEISGLPEVLVGKGEKARDICAEMFGKYPERMLLHGDLHHDNILLCTDGSYAVIDPKGVVGPKILDLPRFLVNEPTGTVREAMEWMHVHLRYPLADIRKVYYMEAVLANLWLAEDGEPLWEEILRLAENILEEAYEDLESKS